jgi:hypothetical protein
VRTEFLRPGCILHTLALNPRQRHCALYEDEYIANVSLGITGSHDDSEEMAPILVCCDHMQPRLLKRHLTCGYVLSESPGGGRAMLRAIAGALQSTFGVSDSHNSPATSDLGSFGMNRNASATRRGGGGGGGGSRGGISPRAGSAFATAQTPAPPSSDDGNLVKIDMGTPSSVASYASQSTPGSPFDTSASRRTQGRANGGIGRSAKKDAPADFEDASPAVFSTGMSNTE